MNRCEDRNARRREAHNSEEKMKHRRCAMSSVSHPRREEKGFGLGSRPWRVQANKEALKHRKGSSKTSPSCGAKSTNARRKYHRSAEATGEPKVHTVDREKNIDTVDEEIERKRSAYGGRLAGRRSRRRPQKGRPTRRFLSVCFTDIRRSRCPVSKASSGVRTPWAGAFCSSRDACHERRGCGLPVSFRDGDGRRRETSESGFSRDPQLHLSADMSSELSAFSAKATSSSCISSRLSTLEMKSEKGNLRSDTDQSVSRQPLSLSFSRRTPSSSSPRRSCASSSLSPPVSLPSRPSSPSSSVLSRPSVSSSSLSLSSSRRSVCMLSPTPLRSSPRVSRRRRSRLSQLRRFLLQAAFVLLFSAVFASFSGQHTTEFFAEAIVCGVEAPDGLLAAATAAGSSTPALDIFALPLCRLPYLVNSAIPPKDAPHVGLLAGGFIDIDLEILPSNYVNNLPLRRPRFSGEANRLSTGPESPQRDALFSTAAPARGLAAFPSVVSLSDKKPEERASTVSSLFSESRSLPVFFNKFQENLAGLACTFQGLARNFFSELREAVAFASPTLLSRASRLSKAERGESTVNAVSEAADNAARVENSKESARAEKEKKLSEMEARRLAAESLVANPLRDDPLVAAVNNTYVLVMDHFQFLFFEQDGDWLPSFTAADNVVANSYIPAFKRLPFASSRLRVRIQVPRRDRYAVVLLNADGLDLRLRGSVTFLNPDAQQLSAEQLHLPDTVFGLMILYLVTSGVLVLLMLVFRRRRWNGVHLLMLGNFLFAALAFSLDWRQAVYMAEHGIRHPALWVASRVFKKMQDISALMTFILVSLGWKTLRSQLSRIEVQFVAGLCVISLYLGFFEIILGGFQGTRYILHALGYICVLVAINANLALLHAHIADSSLSPSTGELYHKYDGYQTYRWIFFLYLMKPVTLVFYKLTFLNLAYEQLLSWDEWVFVLVDNLMDYLIYVGLLYAFRPVGSMRVLRDLTPENASSASGTRAPPATTVSPA
ncbi:hypothetical protein TGGT1_216890 [Toxoplasma gondii GT1]|uniref:Uncharacterized protein n=3 Tax=Toxoplasma gondii TaxID=5811 RepID=S7UL38_TOXGG|nr:hypothetical protein TGGT1_216890 [Toxoplasma gondii GT1]RQX67230.1 lung seven transmembrane receptor [Toxoplasma gondii CAST]